MGCVCCGAGLAIGALCRRCALEVVPCDGLIPDHVRSKLEAAASEAWVIDGFGGAHPIGACATLGRSHRGDVVVLASSVSREHAAIRRTATGWTVRDLGSRNGTVVDGARAPADHAVPVAARARLQIGNVALWFIAGRARDLPPALMTTGRTASGLTCYQLVHGTAELRIIVGGDPASGGALLWRAIGSTAWSESSLAPLELQLVRALCARSHAEAGSPARIRGCVSTKQLAHELPFLSRFANQDNVRQVVMRVRAVLADAGAAGLLAVAPGRGYYFACSVIAAASTASVESARIR
jgi:hypothetical protein